MEETNDGGGGGAGGKVVVCDSGTGLIKCGFAGDNFPRVFPCLTGRAVVRKHGKITKEQLKDLMVGEECTAHSEQLELCYPVENGAVRSWDDMAAVWAHAFRHHLRVDPADCKVMLTEPALNPVANRDKTLQHMFEGLGFQAAYISNQAVLTLYAQGLITGLVLDSGDGVTVAVPVYEGFSPAHAIKRLELSGRHITRHMLSLLTRSGYALNRSKDFEPVRQLKEGLCYVAYDYERELKLAKETTVVTRSFSLPDGQVIKVGAERFMACEPLFRPSLLEVEGGGIAELVFDCIQELDIDIRSTMYKHIVLSGGNTMFPGFSSRMEKELKQLYLDRILKGDTDRMDRLKLRVEDPPRRRHMVFLGAAVLADIMKDRPEFWVSKQEYAEDPHRALKKCGMVS